MHNAAREMVGTAEQGMLKGVQSMDSAWPEMLNHATQKVTFEVRELRAPCELAFVTVCLQVNLPKTAVSSISVVQLQARAQHVTRGLNF